jgi:hypothetical protein
MTAFLIPTIPQAQTFSIELGNLTYTINLVWNVSNETWILDLITSNGVPILRGIPLVGGTDLLEPYAYLGIGGTLYAMTSSDPLAAPTYANMGTEGQLFFVTTP